MSGSTLSSTTRKEIAEQMEAAGGERVAMAKRLAARHGCSVSTVYKHADRGGKRRPRKAARPEYRGWVTVAVSWAHRSPEPMPLETAIAIAIEVGDLPAAAADMSIATAQRIRRELGLKLTSKRTHRLCADYPLQAVLLDASTSQYLVVDGDDAGEGDATRLRLHTKPATARHYKNKPTPTDKRRVLVYSLWDMCTGIYRARYVAGRGENALDAMDFLCWALAPSGDPRVLLHGVPDDLWVDQGPLVKSAAARDLLDRLGIDIVLGAPYAKTRMGGVERTHRTRWQSFERPLFARVQDTITLGELNARLSEFEVREHARRLARKPVDGRLLRRTEAWVPLMAGRPADNPLRALPANPIETLAREARRRANHNGEIRWDNVLYESPWHDCWVVARRAVDGSGDLAITHEDTGETSIARRSRGGDYNRIRAAAATPLDKVLAQRAEQDKAEGRKGADVFAPGAAGNVAPMRAKAAPARPLENPLAAADACRDLDDAMALFVSHFGGRLQPGDHARVRALVDRTGLDRRKVIELAQTLRKKAV